MATIRFEISEEMRAGLEARASESDYADVADYLRDLIQADLEDSWEMTPELAAALAEGEASGIDSRSIEDIIADGRKRAGL